LPPFIIVSHDWIELACLARGTCFMRWPVALRSLPYNIPPRYLIAMSATPSDQVRNLATLVIEKHGIRAASVAQQQALKAKSEGDIARAGTCEEVARVVEGALRESLDR
jgi:hypothetical protein